MWIFAILVVLALGGIAVLAAGRGTPMAPAYDDRPDAAVPAAGDLVGDDLRRVRFSLAFRGYRMSEVDALLQRLAAQVDGEPWPPEERAEETPVEETPADPAGPAHAADLPERDEPAGEPADDPDDPDDPEARPVAREGRGGAATD